MDASTDPQERSFIDDLDSWPLSGRGVDALVVVTPTAGRVYIDVPCAPPPHGYTPLFYAATRGWCTAITWLLKKGADVHAGAPSSRCDALHGATFAAAVLLLDAGARVDVPDSEGNTALHYAAESGNEKTCKLLLSRGASLDVRTYEDPEDPGYGGKDPEALARRGCSSRSRAQCLATAAFLAEVRAAGGWDKYVHEPRAELLALRQRLPSLRERGRASPSTVRAHERLFLDARLPDEVFSQIVAFWRSSRDY